jgi:phosphatidate cytidylyltransferase
VTRVLSALVLIPVVVGIIWFLPPIATLILAEVAALLAFIEYADLARALGAQIPRVIAGAAVLAACAALALMAPPFAHQTILQGSTSTITVVLLSAFIVVGAVTVGARQPGPGVLSDVAVSLLPVSYIGLPLGALVAVLIIAGREALLLLMAAIVVSDSAQYYTGRAFGRHPLAPAISPKKTREGAIGGLVFGTAAFVIGGRWVFPLTPVVALVLVGATIAAAGMVGDLFESLLKRSAGVKDSSHLIPGHGGVLDRLDSWLFAAPIYYVFVRYLR